MAWLDLQSEIESEFAELRLDSEQKVQSFLYGRAARERSERSANKKDRYAWCKAAGFCFDCGKRTTPGKYPRCEEHLRKLLDQIRDKKKRIAAEGLCIDCGDKREPERANGVYCVACKEYHSARWRAKHPPRERNVSGNCSECGKEIPSDRFSTKLNQASKTCSKRCTQIARRKELIAQRVCVKCKKNGTRDGLQVCDGCNSNNRKIAQKPRGYTVRCGTTGCHNHVAIGVRAGMQPGFCCRACANREMDRRKRERKAARVLVISSESEHPEVSQSVTMLIGKCGRIVSSDADHVVVRFYGGKTHALRPTEVCVLS